MSHILNDLKTFLEESPTSWHAVQGISNRLALREYLPLNEEESWSLSAGKHYFVARGGSMCAFCLPEHAPRQMTVLASHTDSPSFKLKPRPVFEKEDLLQLGTEVYGAPLLSSWLNRDLTIAGRVVVVSNEGKEEVRLVHIDDSFAFIPQLAPHLDRESNDKGLILNKHEHLCPVLGLSSAIPAEEALEKLLRRHLSFQSLLSYELFLVPAEAPRFIGVDGELLAGYRIDNLVSAHAAVCALGKMSGPSQDTLRVALFLDHEEIGSSTREGNARFLQDVLTRIYHHLKLNAEEQLQINARSLCVSIDVAHALNPNYPAKHDAAHTPRLGKGVVLKYNANQKYASTAISSAPVIRACKTLNLPFQEYAARADIPSGSTIGPLLAEQTGIPTVDIGCAQLSMHSAREVIAVSDYLDLVSLLTHLFNKE